VKNSLLRLCCQTLTLCSVLYPVWSSAQSSLDNSIIAYQAPVSSTLTLSAELSAEAIEQVASHVAQWQLNQFDIASNKMRVEDRVSGLPNGWMYATCEIGLLRYAQQQNQTTYLQALVNLSKLNDWQLGPRWFHADDQAIGAVYLQLADLYATPAWTKHVTEQFDLAIAQASERSLDFRSEKKEVFVTPLRTFTDPYCTVRWCWADAIFMAPPVLAQLSKVRQDPRYLSFMDKEFWATTDYLFDKDYQLYLRDSRYFDRKDAQGRPIFWGRGNGWVLAGLARTIEWLPADYPQRARYIALFQALSKSMLAYQHAEGSWPSSLLEEESQHKPESSATGLLVFALAWGMNQGLLEGEQYRSAIQRGWQSLVSCVHPDGKLGYVQQVAFAPGSATFDDTQLYGTGALLLAAAELQKSVEKQK
jgi:unsaturated rhamnogalacturonyl hydrolase